MKRLALVMGVCLATACSQPTETPSEAAPAETSESGVHMDAATQQRTGVVASAIEAVNAPRTVEGYARVMDVGPLAAIDAEVGAAQSAALASREEYRRLQALAAADQAASVRAVEAARAQAGADGARAELASRRIGLEWGPGLVRLSPAQRSQLLSDVAAGRAALMRVDASGAGQDARRVILRPDGGAVITATILGAAGGADPRLQTAGVLAVVRGRDATRLPAGRLIGAQIELGGAEPGFLLPSAAIIRTENAMWVYVRTGADTFERRAVLGARAIDRGWFVSEGVAAGDMIVTEGAASLLAAERGPVEAE
ncbi:RND efflux system, membrane fusion protein CmeA [alpha proteobacterium U9-1i]|nr:RND efflux system, membrane fusion protein CmeA [alpha proteobacterium U9-1i]